MMRYEWTPASEPPDSDRWVLAWHKESVWSEEGPRLNCYFREHWLNGRGSITHWRDVEPPNSSATLTGSPDVPEADFGNMAGGE